MLPHWPHYSFPSVVARATTLTAHILPTQESEPLMSNMSIGDNVPYRKLLAEMLEDIRLRPLHAFLAHDHLGE